MRDKYIGSNHAPCLQQLRCEGCSCLGLRSTRPVLWVRCGGTALYVLGLLEASSEAPKFVLFSKKSKYERIRRRISELTDLFFALFVPLESEVASAEESGTYMRRCELKLVVKRK